MRLLFCTTVPVDKKLGYAKLVIELAEELQTLGWTCEFATTKELGGYGSFKLGLKTYLENSAHKFDVVDFDHSLLPYARQLFSPKTLFVARSQLLIHFVYAANFPEPWNLRRLVSTLLLRRICRMYELRQIVQDASITCREADVVVVSNTHEKEFLEKLMIPPAKIEVCTPGLSRSLATQYFRQEKRKLSNNLAFVGTFEFRKGAKDFPKILSGLLQHFPDVSLKLLGTRGLFINAEAVRDFFPAPLRERLVIHESFKPEELPGLLADCAVGLFPSYLEGFGYGVLEMLAAGLPVIAYDCPGPSMMLPREWLAALGDHTEFTAKVVGLLQNPKLAGEQARALAIAKKFLMQDIAGRWSETLKRRVNDLRRSSVK